jgi:hypothetical protein
MDDAATARESADAFDRLELSARAAGRSMQAAFSLAEADGKRLDETLRSIGARLADMAVQSAGQAASQALRGGLSDVLPGLATGSSAGGGGAAAGDSYVSAAAPAANRGFAVIMNVTTPDADSFQRSEAQVSAALVRAVARGNRAM